MRKIHLIFTRSLNHVIGHEGKLLWASADFVNHIVKLTKGQAVLMGRKTWELFGCVRDAQTIVLTHQKDFAAKGASVYHDIYDVLNDIADKDIWVLGGADVFKQMLQFADEVVVGTVQTKVDGDTRFEFASLISAPTTIEIGEAFAAGDEYSVRIEHYDLKA